MKKIININLSGRVIPIEDSAYEKLQQYIDSLRRYFSNEEGRDEIINDIESRIAELMSDKVRKGADSVTDTDVEEIISSMGRVEDFEAADQETAAASSGSSAREQQAETTYIAPKKGKGRLYRDTSDKFLGGVCSGVANYLNIDPSIIRILFAIITFGGFGLGVLVYIILWIVLPPKDMEGFSGKKLYRNPDDKIIGGVAGGLAAYFGKSARTIRLIFAAPLLLSMLVGVINGMRWDYDAGWLWNIGFGSLSGTFILTYIILWMVLPEANSDYQKMEMRGETVDINRIRQNVKEGMGGMKDKMKDWGEEVKSSAQNFSNKAKEFAGTKGKAFAAEVNETAKRGGRGLGHAIGVLFKVFFLFIAGTIAFALFVSLIALLFGGVAWWPVNNFLWTSSWQQGLAWATLILFLVVPLVAFITWIIRRITRARSKSNYLGWTFGGLWTLGWVAMVLFVTSITRDFRHENSVITEVAVTQPQNGKMIVAVSKPELEYTGQFGWMNDGSDGWDLSDDTLKIAAIKFNVKASTDADYHVQMKRYSFGKTKSDAVTRAGKIQYAIASKDSVLDIDNGYAIDKDSKFRGQYVEVEIMVPVGKKIRFDESVKKKLNSINVKVKRSYRRDRVVGVVVEDDDDSFRYIPGVDYTMGPGGELTGPGGIMTTKPDNDYRYLPADTTAPAQDPAGIQKLLDEEKRKKEESDRKIRELEDKIKASKPGAMLKKVKKARSDGAFAMGPSPVNSVTQWF
jgi:phage shock protein PspC (stress-responsive transcriptional regulator)